MKTESAEPLRIRDGLVAAALVLLVSGAAFAATAHNCSTTDGSFHVADGKPSLYCRVTDLFPPALDSVHGIVVCVLLFLTPFATVVLATALCAWSRRPLPRRLLLAALVVAGFTLLLSLFGGVGYEAYA